jgi:hypothetical protein
MRARIPLLEIRLSALPPTCLREVQMYDHHFAHVLPLVLFRDLAEQEELLGSRIRQRNEAAGGKLDAEIICLPVPRP